MNKKQIIDSLGAYIESSSLNESLSIDNIQWKTQLCNEKTILFYALSDTLLGKESFKKRIEQTSYGILITDCDTKNITSLQNTITIKKEYWLKAQQVICDEFYPIKGNCKLVAVTGTNGKTTTVDFMKQIGNQNGLNILGVGTLGVSNVNQIVFETGLTTPPYIWIRKFISEYEDSYDAIVFEVSSHALSQERVFEIKFDLAAWSSFSQDHLDYHGTLENYFEAKKKILNHLRPKAKIFFPNSQSKLASKLKSDAVEVLSVFPEQKQEIPAFLKSSFNQDNFMLAKKVISSLLGSKAEVNFEKISVTPGRFNIIEWKQRLIVIDFAHTPDALLNIGENLRETYPGSKLTTIFGCGGDRDKSKRPLMGKVVSTFSDFAYLTNDNPRSENPMTIVEDIVPGMQCKFEISIDREICINKALNLSKGSDIILIAGKGHENYILINDEKIDYSDHAVVEKFIGGKND